MKKNALPKKTLILWQIRVLVFNILLVALCLFFSKSLDFLKPTALIIAIIALAVIVLYLPAYFKGYEIALKGEAVIISHGVFVRIDHIMPYSRLIYAQSFASPMARLLGVSSVTLKAARGWIIVPEIENKDAQKIISFLAQEGENG